MLFAYNPTHPIPFLFDTTSTERIVVSRKYKTALDFWHSVSALLKEYLALDGILYSKLAMNGFTTTYFRTALPFRLHVKISISTIERIGLALLPTLAVFEVERRAKEAEMVNSRYNTQQQ